MPNRPLCEVCGKPEATGEDSADTDAVCWTAYHASQHSPGDVLEVLRATRRERDDARAELLEMDALRARLASLPVAELVAYGKAWEEWAPPWRADDYAALQEARHALQTASARWREWEEKP